MRVQSLGQEEPLEKGMATHCSILAWRIPWTGKPGGLQSMGHTELDTTEVTQHACINLDSKGFRILIYLRTKGSAPDLAKAKMLVVKDQHLLCARHSANPLYSLAS